MSELFNNLPEKGEYKYNADEAGERAEDMPARTARTRCFR